MNKAQVDTWYSLAIKGLAQAREHLLASHEASLNELPYTSAVVFGEIPSAVRSLGEVKCVLYETLGETPDRRYDQESELRRFGTGAEDTGAYEFPMRTDVRGRIVSTIWNPDWGNSRGRYETVVFMGSTKKPVYEQGYETPGDAGRDHEHVVCDIVRNPGIYRPRRGA